MVKKQKINVFTKNSFTFLIICGQNIWNQTKIILILSMIGFLISLNQNQDKRSNIKKYCPKKLFLCLSVIISVLLGIQYKPHLQSFENKQHEIKKEISSKVFLVNANYNYFYIFPQYSYNPGPNRGLGLGSSPNGYNDDNILYTPIDFGNPNSDYYSTDPFASCNTFTFQASSGNVAQCNNMNLVKCGGNALCANFPMPNQNCALILTCSDPSIMTYNIQLSSYAYLSQEPGSSNAYTALTISPIVIYLNQIYSLSANTLVSPPSSFTLNNATMYLQSYSNTKVTTSISENNIQFSFSAIQSSTAYYIMLTTNLGNVYSNQFSVQVIQQCYPSISVNSLYSQSDISATAPFSVFTATSSDVYSSYCSKLSFKLYNSTGLIDVSSNTTPYSFNTVTGEFKITSFTGYFNMNFYVQVTNQFNSATQYTASTTSESVNILYQVDCTPSITVPTGISQIGVTLATPYSVFVAQTYSTNNNPTYCQIKSYTLLDSAGTTDISSITTPQSFNTATGEFKITSFSGINPNSYFTNLYILRVNSDYISGTSSVKSAQTLCFTVDFQQSTVVTCTPIIGTLSNFYGYVTSLTTPLKVFMASQFSSTTYSSNCVLSYSLYDSAGTTPVSSSTIMSFNSVTGEFDITAFTNNIFEQTITIKITSTFSVSINSIFTGQIIIRQVYCSPQITIGNYIYSLNSFTAPYSVFTSQSLSSIQNNPTYCSLTSYTLYDSTGATALPPASAPYSFNTNTGEFIITTFTGYFYLQVIVQVNGIYSPTSSAMSTKSAVITIQYVVCTPTITGLGNFENQVYSLTTPYTLFTASTYFSTFSPCTLSYNIYSYPLGTDITSITTPFQFLQPSGVFQIISYTNNIFEYNITIKVTASYSSSSGSLTTSQILIRQVYCLPSITGLSKIFNYSINVLTFPYTVFRASDYASTTNPTYCSLSYKVTKQDGSNFNSSQNMTINSQTGKFQIAGYSSYTILYFENFILLQVTSQYLQYSSVGQTINQSISIYIFTCYPYIVNNEINSAYNYTADPLVSIYNPQQILVIYAYYTTQTALSQLCILTYKTYFKNGLEATYRNSQFGNQLSTYGLYLTSNMAFTQTYYYQATATSSNPPYSNSVNSKLFTINVKSAPVATNLNSDINQQILPCKMYSTKYYYPNFTSNANVTYLPQGQCDIQTTRISMDGFNANFILNYETGNSIQVNFKSFVTNNSLCSIQSYQILPYQSLSFPAYLDQIATSSNDQTQSFNFNLANINFGQIYKFQIQATAVVKNAQPVSGNTCLDYQKIIQDAQITVYRNCSYDKVYQIQTMPLKNESYFNSYKSVNRYPVLFLNISQKENINIDISSRFKNDYNECILSYQISEIDHNGSAVNLTLLNNFISLTSNGIFSVKNQLQYAFDHYQILIVANNKANVNSTLNGFLIDLSVYKIQKTYIYQTKSQSSKNFEKKIKTKLSKSQACSGFISSINNQGQLQIIFNDIIDTKVNASWINSSNTQMYVKPGSNRQEDEDFDFSSVNFTWSVQSFIKETMLVQLNFNQPIEISPLIQQDQLIVNFNGSQDLIYCVNKKTFLDSDYSIMLHNIPAQMANSNDLQQIGQVASLFAGTPVWLLVVGTLVVVIGFGNIEYMVIYIRTLQLIMLLTSIQIVFPANLVNYLKIIHSIVSYDILSYYNMYSLPILNKLQFDSNANVDLISQMQNVGYDNRNAMLGLATFTFLIIIFFLRLFLVILMKLICFILRGRFYSKQIYYYISKNLSFNPILSMSIEGFFDFLIFGYLNMKTAEFTTNGEYLGFSFGIFSLLASGLILPITLIVALIVYYKYKLEKEDFDKKWGAQFEMVKMKNMSSRIYMIIFYIRRMIILAFCFFAPIQYSSLILVFTCAVNHIYSIYIGSTKPLKSKQLNNLEIFNEFFVASSTFFVMILSDWAGSQQKKYFHGFAFIILILLHSSSNVIIILMKTFNNVILIFTKVYNLIQSYQNKWKKTQSSSNNQKNNIIKLKVIPNEINEGKQQISETNINEQVKKQRQNEIFNKIIAEQNEKLPNMNQQYYQAYKTKMNQKNPYYSIYSVHPQKKICDLNVQNPNEYILSLNKILIISKSDNKEKPNLEQANNENLNDLKNDEVYQKFLVLYNKYEFLYVTDEDQFRIKEKQKYDFFDFLDPYVFKSQDQRLNLLRKSKFLVNYARSNVKLMKNDMKKKGIKDPEQQVINLQDELFDFINENYILCLKLEKKEYLQFIK